MLLGLQPANPAVVKKWRAWGLTNAGASGGLFGLVELIKKIFPEAILARIFHKQDFWPVWSDDNP